MKNTLETKIAVACMALMSSMTCADVITFDEMGVMDAYSPPQVFSEIGPMIFSVRNIDYSGGIFVYRPADPRYSINSSNAVDLQINSIHRASLINGENFNFSGVYLSGTAPFSVTFKGWTWDEGYKYSEQMIIPAVHYGESPLWYGFDWKGVAFVELDIGVINTGYLSMDNFTYTTSLVPLPPSLYLFASSLIGLVSISVKRAQRIGGRPPAWRIIGPHPSQLP